MVRARRAREARRRTSNDKEREMAVNVERDPVVYAIENDPMAMRRPAPAIADPAPLGLAALALTTLVFSVFNAGLINRAGEPVVLGLALAYGGVTQLLAGMWEFRRGNTFGATVFGSFGAFWLSYWALEQFFVKTIPLSQVLNAMALFFIVWAIFAALMWVAAVRTTAAVSVVLALLTVTFLLLGIGDAGAHTTLVKIAGWFGIATAAAGLYAAFAALVNTTYERTLLPLRAVRHVH
jgi:uncharacterized protein